MRTKQRKRNWILAVAMLVVVALLAGCTSGGSSGGKSIKLADTQWQSLWINNAIAGFIIEKGYGYKVETVEMTTPIMQQSIVKGDIDVSMELWKSNIVDWYNEVIEKGEIIELSPIFERASQGWYVPRYMVEGPNAVAPDLRSVSDLKKYKHLFPDPENPDKGLLINCITGWQCAKVNEVKLHAYGLAGDFNLQEPGASAALDAAIAGAYQRQRPFLAYYWEPTWLVGAFDLIQLEEPPYSAACDAELQKAAHGEIPMSAVTPNAGCGFEVEVITKIVNPSLKERAPEVVEFLDKMTVGTDNLNRISAYMEAEEATAEQAALWFFENHQDLWRSWIPADVAEKVEQALKQAGANL